MPNIGTSIFTNPDDYCDSYRDAKINLVFTAPGNFQARLTWVELPGLNLLSVQESVPRIAAIVLPPARIFLTFPTHFTPPPVWNGTTFRAGNILICGLAERLYQRTDGITHWASISVNPEVLAEYSLVLAGFDPPLHAAGRILSSLSPAAMQLRRLHAGACRLATTRPDTMAHPEAARSLENELLHALVNCMAFDPAFTDDAAERHANVMARFDALLERDFDLDHTVEELAAAIGMSERSLRRYCAETFAMSPHSYMRLRRLNLVRASLCRVDHSSMRVADVASRHGFSKAGHLALEYQRIFGETPAATLHRNRVRPTIPNLHSSTRSQQS